MSKKRKEILQIILSIFLLDLVLYAVLHYLMLYNIPDSSPLSAQAILGLIRMAGCCILALYFGGRTQWQAGRRSAILVAHLTLLIVVYSIVRTIPTALMTVVWGGIALYSVEHPIRVFICENLLDVQALFAYYLFVLIYLLRTHFPQKMKAAQS